MKAKAKISFDTVRQAGLALPGVEAGTAYGSPALLVGGKMIACRATHRSAEPDSLVVVVGFDERQELIAADPNTYYLTKHYVNYPSVLVRLNRIHRDALRDLLQMACRFVTAAAKRPVGGRKRGLNGSVAPAPRPATGRP